MNSLVLLDAGAVTRCRRRVHLEHDPSARDVPRAAADPTAEQRIADAAAHRRAVAEVLAADRAWGAGSPGDWAQVPSDLPTADRVARTAELLAAGTPLVWGAVLPADLDGGRRGSCDLLVRSRNGYVPILVVRHKVSDPGSGALTSPLAAPWPRAARRDPERKPRPQSRDQLRLAHVTRLLRAAGLAASGPARGGVVGLDADVVLWHDLDALTWPGGRSALDEYDARFADRLAIARAAVIGAQALAEPSRVTECRSCPWWPTCGAALRAGRDVSMVLRGEDAVALREAGIGTVDDLAVLDPAADPPIPLAGMAFDDAVLLARAWQRNLSLVRRNREVAVPRAEVEVDIDMESFGDAGAYLWGCLLSGAEVGIESGYRSFATWEPVPTGDEARSFAEFWAWLQSVRAAAVARGLSFRAYCYNELAENRWMLYSAERFTGEPGVPTLTEVREFISSPEWVDLFAVVSTEFLCAHGKGLKTIAPAAGFSWHDPEAGGENSMRWYRAAVGIDAAGGTTATPDETQRDRLLVYNADDVAATRALRRWMSSPAVHDVPWVGDL